MRIFRNTVSLVITVDMFAIAGLAYSVELGVLDGGRGVLRAYWVSVSLYGSAHYVKS
jgi:hypothetical protein